MARDVRKMLDGSPILKRAMDFTVVEPVYGGEIKAQPVLFIEGIYATSSDFDKFESLRFDIPTPLATSIGRRLLRDIKERPNFSDPGVSLKYILEQAEPMWRKQSA
jgi:uridine kinase